MPNHRTLIVKIWLKKKWAQKSYVKNDFFFVQHSKIAKSRTQIYANLCLHIILCVFLIQWLILWWKKKLCWDQLVQLFLPFLVPEYIFFESCVATSCLLNHVSTVLHLWLNYVDSKVLTLQMHCKVVSGWVNGICIEP